MAEFKLVLSDPKIKKAFQMEVKSPDADRFLGLKLGDTVRGEAFNLAGFEFQITGGSDKQGFPMRKDVQGPRRVSALIGSGPGIRSPKKGERKRKSVRGNQISEDIAQINLKVTKEGHVNLAKALGKEEAPPEAGMAPKVPSTGKEAEAAKPETGTAPKAPARGEE